MCQPKEPSHVVRGVYVSAVSHPRFFVLSFSVETVCGFIPRIFAISKGLKPALSRISIFLVALISSPSNNTRNIARIRALVFPTSEVRVSSCHPISSGKFSWN